jgi:pyridoxine 4-dehydrogenase
MTWRPVPIPDEQAFATMKAALANGVNLWNGGDLYGTRSNNSLHLLNRYFTAYPEDASQVILSIKVGTSGREEDLRHSLEYCLQVLDGKKSIDIFQCARVDTTTPIQETIAVLARYVREGKIGGIGLSEPDAATIRHAHKIHPIIGVEVEMSLWSTDILTNGIAATCGELGIPVIAHSPLGHGFLTGEITHPNDIPPGDIRKHLARFQPDAFEKNLERVREIQALAKKKGCTAAQIALAWVRSFSRKEGFSVVVPIVGATRKERMTENAVIVELQDDDFSVLDNMLSRTKVIGGRYM